MKTKIIISTSITYYIIEKHLQRMRQQGWELVSYCGMKYRFKRTLPCTRNYFIYHAGGVLRDDGKYSLTLRHWNIPKTYGVSLKYSELNRFTEKTDSNIRIVEIDPLVVNRESFSELIDDRRILYFREFLKKYVLLSFVTVFFSVVLRRYLLVTILCTAASVILLTILLLGVIFHIGEGIRK